MERISKSEERMAKEIIEQARSVAEELGIEEQFIRRLVSDAGDGKRIVTAFAGINPSTLKGILMGLLGGNGVTLGGLATLAPATLAALLAAGPIALKRGWNWLKRETGIDPHAGLPWMIEPSGDTMADPSWDEPKGSEHMKDIPGYAQLPYAGLMPEYDEARDIEGNALRDAVRIPSEYGTSGDSARTLRERYMRPREVSTRGMRPSGPASSPLDEVSATRFNRASSTRPKFRKVAQLFDQPFDSGLVNAPEENPFLGFLAPGSQEVATSVFGDQPGVITPITQRSPRVLPQGGAGYSPEGGALKWKAGGTPYETALNKVREFADPRYAVPALTAGAEALMNSVLLKVKGGVLDPRTARSIIDQFPKELIAAGIPPEVVNHIYSEAMARLESGGGGYKPSAVARYEDLPYGGDYTEGPFDSGRRRLIENIERSQGRLQDIGSFAGGAAVEQDVSPEETPAMAKGMGMMGF